MRVNNYNKLHNPLVAKFTTPTTHEVLATKLHITNILFADSPYVKVVSYFLQKW